MVGGRDAEFALMLMDDLRGRLANRVQLTTDGHKAYLNALVCKSSHYIRSRIRINCAGPKSKNGPGDKACPNMLARSTTYMFREACYDKLV
jgi:hypothetical protein